MAKILLFAGKSLMIILLTAAGFSCSSILNKEHISTSYEYSSLQVPLTRQTNIPSAGVEETGTGKILLNTGEYTLSLDGGMLLLTHGDLQTGIALRPLGEDLNLFSFPGTVEVFEEGERCRVIIHGSTSWADFFIELLIFPYNPGLFHYKIELAPFASPPPAGAIRPEWCFVDTETGTVSSGGYISYADRAPGAAPCLFGYAEALNSTLLYWTDLTRLNDFCQTVHYSPIVTPVRRGYTFGHNIGWNDIRRLPENSRYVIYDSYLYLVPDKPSSEEEVFMRYLSQISDIYDLLARPNGLLPDWKKIAEKTIIDLSDPDTYIILEGKKYWRAYVGDTRKTAEAITQLDIGVAAAHYKERYGGTEQIEEIIHESLSALDDFFNPKFGLIQNSGPLAVTGDQGRGDTWYELGHALKAAEWGLLGYKEAADMAKKSRDSWIDFANAVNYRFPQFYIFNEWQGTGREPDAAGGYALYMIRLSDLYEEDLEKDRCLQEAMNAVKAFHGYGFGFSYETHMTAAAAAAAAELAVRTGDMKWLEYSYGPIANLIRLSWLYEVDYGFGDEVRTFFGLCPTQRSAAITPKEQYEAWIYLAEYLRLAHGKIDPAVEKLVAEFCYHTLLTLVDSLPPLVPEGIITKNPAAYETVGYNRLDLHIPIEDMRDGWDIWGAIGQEVYGAGMALSFAALAYEEIFPGKTVYSGYPIADIIKIGETCSAVTFSGIPGTFTPVVVTGCTEIYDDEGNPVPVEAQGLVLLFTAEGGFQYFLHYQL